MLAAVTYIPWYEKVNRELVRRAKLRKTPTVAHRKAHKYSWHDIIMTASTDTRTGKQVFKCHQTKAS